MKNHCQIPLVTVLLLAGCGQKNPVPTQVAESGPKPSKPAVVEPPRKPPANPPKKDDLIGDLFGLGKSVIKGVDDIGQEIFGLTPKEQKEIGARLHRKLKAKHGLHHDPV